MNVSNDDQEFIEVQMQRTIWIAPDGRAFIQKDFRVGGELWRINKYDADPFPSSSHAHCVDGSTRIIGCKLHLGTRELCRGRQPLGRYLEERQFLRLIELIRPNLPGIQLPIPGSR